MRFCLLAAEMENYNVMIDRKNFFEYPEQNYQRTYNNIQKTMTGQGDDFTTSFLLDYVYFKNYFKMVSTDFNKKQALDAD